jgi:hypothetical protein
MGILLLTRSHLRPLACANNTNEHWHISSFAFPLLASSLYSTNPVLAD